MTDRLDAHSQAACYQGKQAALPFYLMDQVPPTSLWMQTPRRFLTDLRSAFCKPVWHFSGGASVPKIKTMSSTISSLPSRSMKSSVVNFSLPYHLPSRYRQISSMMSVFRCFHCRGQYFIYLFSTPFAIIFGPFS